MNKTIRILSTSDVHGCIFPYTYADGTEKNHGFARIKTLIDSLRDENTIVLDNGDTIEGTPFTFYHYANYPDEVCEISKVMKEIGFDYINLGNHDFNYGEKTLFAHIDATGSKCLTANVLYKDKNIGPEYVIHNIGGKKLALFALTTQHVPNWERPENIRNLKFIDAYECAKKIVKDLKEKENPDYIVCAYHGGFECDVETGKPSENPTGENEGYKMVSEIEGIDVLICGHQHRTTCGKVLNTYYTQPAFDGMYLSCIEIDTETDEITPRLIDVTSKADEKIISMCQKKEDEVQKWLDTPLGKCDLDLKVHDELDCRLNKSQLATLINIIQLEESKADLSGSAIFMRASGFDKNITMRNIVTTYLFPNTLMVKKINGKILKEYLEKCAEFWAIRDDRIVIAPNYDFPTPQYHNYDMVDGIEYTIKVSNPIGSRITELKRDGKDVKDDDEFTLAINNYRGVGGGNFDMIKDAPLVKEIQRSVVDIIGEYIEKHKTISFEEKNNIKVII